MKPDAAHILRTSFGTILGEVAPHIDHDYAGGSVTVIGLLMVFAAQDYQQGAEIRARENAAMRSLFADALPLLGQGDLRRAVAAASASRDADLTMATLNASNAALKQVLIELQAHLETREDDGAQALDDRIWRILRQFADGRRLDLPML